MTGMIQFSARKVVASVASTYYNHTFYEVPFVGEFDESKIRAALHAKVYTQFNQLGKVTKAREPGVIRFEVLHTLGD